jgi:PIN domain nuclease of toxin-antitoxin system
LVKLLLDTSTFLWLAIQEEKLSRPARAAIQDRETEVYVSSISCWELMMKSGQGKLPLLDPPQRFIAEFCETYRLEQMLFSFEDAFQILNLPRIHSDPFDRMLICQAIANNCSIVTPDQAIRQYPIHTIW